MKKKRGYILAIIMIMIFIVAGFTSEVNAGLQSNPTTFSNPKIDSPETWMKNFRNIETPSGGLGYNETIATDTLLSTSGSNGIDIHMMKNTEMGAILILSVSGYGNASNDKTILSTTGNSTGVMLYNSGLLSENVAAGINGVFKEVDKRYFNLYDTPKKSTSAKIGDGLGSATDKNPGTESWRGGSIYWPDSKYPYLVRFHVNGNSFFAYDADYNSRGHISRGTAVVGQGV